MVTSCWKRMVSACRAGPKSEQHSMTRLLARPTDSTEAVLHTRAGSCICSGPPLLRRQSCVAQHVHSTCISQAYRICFHALCVHGIDALGLAAQAARTVLCSALRLRSCCRDVALDLKLEADLKLLRQPGVLSQGTEAASGGALASVPASATTPADAGHAYGVHLKPGPIEVHPVQFAALSR